ncbi:unnamed protein product [Orchesella dallaii]|uniref:BTB domain-containing protein n=1 Tax=Orchesella dallaii TaxID=48710 RepID=A0ABP1Q1R7_9HEXA
MDSKTNTDPEPSFLLGKETYLRNKALRYKLRSITSLDREWFKHVLLQSTTAIFKIDECGANLSDKVFQFNDDDMCMAFSFGGEVSLEEDKESNWRKHYQDRGIASCSNRTPEGNILAYPGNWIYVFAKGNPRGQFDIGNYINGFPQKAILILPLCNCKSADCIQELDTSQLKPVIVNLVLADRDKKKEVKVDFKPACTDQYELSKDCDSGNRSRIVYYGIVNLHDLEPLTWKQEPEKKPTPTHTPPPTCTDIVIATNRTRLVSPATSVNNPSPRLVPDRPFPSGFADRPDGFGFGPNSKTVPIRSATTTLLRPPKPSTCSHRIITPRSAADTNRPTVPSGRCNCSTTDNLKRRRMNEPESQKTQQSKAMNVQTTKTKICSAFLAPTSNSACFIEILDIQAAPTVKSPWSPCPLLNNLFSERFLADFMIISSNGTVHPTHKVVLAGKSPVFWRLFSNSRRNEGESLERLEFQEGRGVPVTPEAVNAFLKFMYCGDTSGIRNVALAAEILYLGYKYELPDLIAFCSKLIIRKLKERQEGSTTWTADANMLDAWRNILTSVNLPGANKLQLLVRLEKMIVNGLT